MPMDREQETGRLLRDVAPWKDEHFCRGCIAGSVSPNTYTRFLAFGILGLHSLVYTSASQTLSILSFWKTCSNVWGPHDLEGRAPGM